MDPGALARTPRNGTDGPGWKIIATPLVEGSDTRKYVSHAVAPKVGRFGCTA